MRVRILRSIASVHGSYKSGDIAEIPEDIAARWIKNGVAMQDKSMEPKETKI